MSCESIERPWCRESLCTRHGPPSVSLRCCRLHKYQGIKFLHAGKVQVLFEMAQAGQLGFGFLLGPGRRGGGYHLYWGAIGTGQSNTWWGWACRQRIGQVGSTIGVVIAHAEWQLERGGIVLQPKGNYYFISSDTTIFQWIRSTSLPNCAMENLIF